MNLYLYYIRRRGNWTSRELCGVFKGRKRGLEDVCLYEVDGTFWSSFFDWAVIELVDYEGT